MPQESEPQDREINAIKLRAIVIGAGTLALVMTGIGIEKYGAEEIVPPAIATVVLTFVGMKVQDRIHAFRSRQQG
jgi:hypothetical protein